MRKFLLSLDVYNSYVSTASSLYTACSLFQRKSLNSLRVFFLSLFFAAVGLASRDLLRSKLFLPFAVRLMSPSPKFSIYLRKPSANQTLIAIGFVG